MDEINRYKITSEDYFDLIIEYNNNLEILHSYSRNSSYNILDDRYAIVYTPLNETIENAYYLFGYNSLPDCNGLMSSINLDYKEVIPTTNIDPSGVLSIKNNINYDLSGEGVLIGVVDTGIDYTNSTLLNPDKTSRIVSIWDQTIDSENYPQGIYYGTEYSKADINYALSQTNPFAFLPSCDEVGNGTVLAAIAGGNSKKINGFSGIANNCEFAVVKLKQAKKPLRNFLRIPDNRPCFQSNDIMFAVKYLIDLARRLERPIAICIGVSTSQGSHEGLSYLDNYISQQGRIPSVVILVPAGNEGNYGHHYTGQFNSTFSSDEFLLNIGSNSQGFTMEFWGMPPNLYTIDIITPTGDLLGTIPLIFNGKFTQSFTYKNTILYTDNLVLQTFSGAQLVIFRFLNPTSGIWKFKVNNQSKMSSRYDVWLPINNFLTNDVYFLDSNYYTTLTGSANADIPIAITSYNTLFNTIYPLASKGFPRSYSYKPDVAAPGDNIIAPTIDNQLVSASGTGVATAHATGVVALLLEWGVVRGNLTTMNTNNIRNILNLSAIREEEIFYPNQYWGYGKLNLPSALIYTENYRPQ